MRNYWLDVKRIEIQRFSDVACKFVAMMVISNGLKVNFADLNNVDFRDVLDLEGGTVFFAAKPNSPTIQEP